MTDLIEELSSASTSTNAIPKGDGIAVSDSTSLSEFQRLCSDYIACNIQPQSFFDRLYRCMYDDSRIRNICWTQVHRSRLDHQEHSELLQRVILVFHFRSLQKLRESEAAYQVVYAIAENVVRDVRRDALALITDHESVEALREKEIELPTHSLEDNVQDELDDVIDSKNAARRMELALKRHANGEVKLSNNGVFDVDPMVAVVPHTVDPEKVFDKTAVKKSKKDKAPIQLGPDHQELLDIKDALGLQNNEFAAAIGIGLPRLSSYLYGRTASVDEDVMKSARQLMESDPGAKDRVKYFQRPIQVFMDEWKKELGFKDDSELAQFFGVMKITIKRWRLPPDDGGTQPDITAMQRYDQTVKRFSATMQRSR